MQGRSNKKWEDIISDKKYECLISFYMTSSYFDHFKIRETSEQMHKGRSIDHSQRRCFYYFSNQLNMQYRFGSRIE